MPGEHAIDDPRVAERTSHFPESVIREMTRLANKHDAINLSQGFPNFPCPDVLKEGAKQAIDDDRNQYAVTWGTPELREAVQDRYSDWYGLPLAMDENVVVTCGATEAMAATCLSVVDPGDEVVLLEPYYENYWPDTIMSGGDARFGRLEPTEDEWVLDEESLKSAFSDDTAAMILCTPNNPTGKVFDADELGLIRDLAIDHDSLVITDEIYEHIVYDGDHVPLATMDDMWDRTVTISGASKTYSVTGWRVAWTMAPASLTEAIKRTHDFLTVGAPHPLQIGVAEALRMDDSYYEGLRKEYSERRRVLLDALEAAGMAHIAPDASYYVLASIDGLGYQDDLQFATDLVRRGGVAVVPGSSFFRKPESGSHLVRFAFPKTLETLEAAAGNLVDFLAG